MSPSSPTGRMLVARGLYRRWLTKYFSTVTLAGLAPDDEPILLRRIYVPLILTQEKVSEYVSEGRIHHKGKLLADWMDSVERGKVFLVSGEAGSGKTTLVSALVDSLAGEVGDDFNRRFEGYVPFPIRLREAPLDQINSLDELVNWWLEQGRQEVPELDPESVRSFLDMGRGILLLDGLDEVGTLARRTRVMAWLRHHRWIRPSEKLPESDDENSLKEPTSRDRREYYRTVAMDTDQRPPSLVMVTARPSGFEGLKQGDLPPVYSLFVAPFSHEQIRTYLTRWFELRPLRSDQRQSTVDNLVTRLVTSEQAGRLLPLARRPAYLASLAFVHGTRGELPYTRAALYEQLVDAYIEMLDRQRGVLDRAEQAGELPVWERQEKMEVLSAVAFQAHVGATSNQKAKSEEGDRRFLWKRDELEDAVRVAVENGAGRFRTIRSEHVPQITSYFVARTGLLVETREGQYQFGHLSFQEYLTALFILNRATAGSNKAAALERILFSRLGDPGWLEVGVLVLAIDAYRSGGRGHEPILGKLDLNLPEQLAFFSQLLSGEEIRFTMEERRAWIFVWLAFWAIREDDSNLDSVLHFPGNRTLLEEAWEAICNALENKKPSLDELHGLVRSTTAEPKELSASRSLDLLVEGPCSAFSPTELPAPRIVLARGRDFPDQDRAAARLLAIPLLGGFRPDRMADLLGIVANTANLFIRLGRSGHVHPTWVQHSIDNWSLENDSLLQILTERSPLLWWLQYEYFSLRVCSTFSRTTLSPLSTWRLSLRARILQAERCWGASLLIITEKRLQSSDLAPARDRVSSRYRALARDRSLTWGLVGGFDRDRDLDLARDRAQTRVQAEIQTLVMALVLARNLAPNLPRAMAKAKTLDLPLELDRVRARDLERFFVASGQRNKLLKNPPFCEQASWLFEGAIQALTLAWVLRESDLAPTVHRSVAAADLDLFCNSKSVLAPLRDTPFASEAAREWEEILASPFSPIPMLEDALSRMWDELPVNPEGIARLFEKALSELEKSL